MNVDAAIKVAKREALGWFDDMHEAGPILASEVERLRAELARCQSLLDEARTELSICGAFHAVAKKEWQLEVEKVNRLEAELAAAKAASVCPVELVALGDADWECSVGVKCKSSADADRLYNWLRDRMKERNEE